MTKLAANLTMMFNEVDFLDRFEAAAGAGFDGVEYLFPYPYPKEQLAECLRKHSLVQALHNLPAGDWATQLGQPSLAGKRIGVLREMFSTGPSDPEVTALFDQALADLKKGGALIFDPVLTGTNLREATSSAVSGTTHPYELIPAANE